MALPDLASVDDLAARGVAVTDGLETMLTVASSVVRSAAGAPILETTSTVSLWLVDGSQYVDLPGKPVRSVASVQVEGEPVERWKNVHGRLWRRSWGWSGEPLEVTVTMTHGLPEVPAHVVQLVCDLAIMGADAAAEGGQDPRMAMESIDDYRVTFRDDATASAMELPELTRRSLRREFGGTAGVVRFR